MSKKIHEIACSAIGIFFGNRRFQELSQLFTLGQAERIDPPVSFQHSFLNFEPR